MRYQSPTQSSPDFPFYFRIARSLYALLTGRRGEYFLYGLLNKFGLLNQAGRFRFFDSHIYIPLDIPETLYIHDYSLFHGLREINFANVILRELGKDSTLIDCGAAFGQISCRIAKLCPNIHTVISIEPNVESCTILRENLALLGDKSTHLVNAAVSNFNGKGELCFPNGRSDSHSAFIKKSEKGNIDVLRLDDLASKITGDIALKLDVEGGEIAAIQGAAKIIANCNSICFFVEIHPDVIERSNQKAEDILMSINNIRETTWILADSPLTIIDPRKPFFEQVERRIYDVIGISSSTVV